MSDRIVIEIEKQIEVLLHSVNFNTGKIQIHYFDGSKEQDLGRTAFTLFTLARCQKFLENNVLKEVKIFVKSLSVEILIDFEEKNILTLCYLLRAKKLLDLNFQEDLIFLEKQNLVSVYKYTVTMYVYISMVQELHLDEDSYLFSIRNESLKVFEYLLFTGEIEFFPIFSLAEINYWRNDLSENGEFLEKGREFLLKELASQNLEKFSSSGLTKCLEFLSLENQEEKKVFVEKIIDKILMQLEKRTVNKIEKARLGPFYFISNKKYLFILLYKSHNVLRWLLRM